MAQSHLQSIDQVYVKDRQAFRTWLNEHHSRDRGIWIICDKKTPNNRTLSYDDLVEEVLCFGWIDSRMRSLSPTQVMYYISPRKPQSPWVRSNKEKITKLSKEGLLAEAGRDVVERAKKDGSWNIYDQVEDLIIPTELHKALEKNKKAYENFENFSKSIKKQIIWYIISAKKPETRDKRILRIVEDAVNNTNPFI